MDVIEELKSLKGVSSELLYNLFIESFGDYKLNMKITYEQYSAMLKRAGYLPEISFGHYFEGKLIGFLLNGKRMIDSNIHCYILAAGYLPQHRNHFKIIIKMVKQFENVTAELGAKSYITEVLRENRSIIAMLNSLGWKRNKDLVSFRKTLNKPINIKEENETDLLQEKCRVDGIELSIETKLDFIDQIKKDREWISWQNSIESISSVLHDFVILSLKKNKEYLGYGLINKNEGDIPQFHITEENEKYADLLLTSLMRNTNSHNVGFMNIDENNMWLFNLLEKNEFAIHNKSYEYVKEIS